MRELYYYIKLKNLEKRAKKLSLQKETLQKELNKIVTICFSDVEDILSQEEMNKILFCLDLLNNLIEDCLIKTEEVHQETEQLLSDLQSILA